MRSPYRHQLLSIQNSYLDVKSRKKNDGMDRGSWTRCGPDMRNLNVERDVGTMVVGDEEVTCSC